MATFPTRNINQRRRRFGSTRCCFLLLLASIAATSFQGDGVSTFALAAEQRNNNNGGRRQLVRRSDVTEVASAAAEQVQKAVDEILDDAECVERKIQMIYITKKDRTTNEKTRYEMCDWVKQKPNRRCNKMIRKRTRNKNPDIEKKFVWIKHNPREVCNCICNDVPRKQEQPDEPQEEPLEIPIRKSCPVEIDDMEIVLGGYGCTRDGFAVGQTCHYNGIGVGCNSDTFRCMSFTSCTCGVDNTESWVCSLYLPPKCPVAPRPRPLDWEDPPPGHQQRCEIVEREDDEPGVGEETKIELRRISELLSLDSTNRILH